LHPRSIELGLERVHTVLDTLHLRQPSFSIITIAGTNGKGSTAAYCDSILRATGYHVGLYTSPHLVAYNERICIDGEAVSDAALCEAFERVEAARGEVRLTYFEFGTVAALDLFRASKIDIAVLEVGMGGRLDAVNGVDADVAIITSVDVDHTAWLGPDRETIGAEKAGIFRQDRPAVCIDAAPPQSVIDVARRVGAQLLRRDQDFEIEDHGSHWTLHFGAEQIVQLPRPALSSDVQLGNAAGAIIGIAQLAARFPVTLQQIRDGLARTRLRGRFEVWPGPPMLVLDVAHNPEATRALARNLAAHPVPGRTLAVFGMLSDKDIDAVVEAMRSQADDWFVATVQAERAASGEAIAALLGAHGVKAPHVFATPQMAFAAACNAAGESDRIVVFGSFYMVGDILASLG
jgi:dihydrofolate synthase / folylpolyglutamate synthase